MRKMPNTKRKGVYLPTLAVTCLRSLGVGFNTHVALPPNFILFGCRKEIICGGGYVSVCGMSITFRQIKESVYGGIATGSIMISSIIVGRVSLVVMAICRCYS
jgi:hypothetical protein